MNAREELFISIPQLGDLYYESKLIPNKETQQVIDDALYK